MTEFGFPATGEAVDYIRRIAAEMSAAFGIDDAQAIGRIRHFWRREVFLSYDDLTALLHRMPESWAKHIYYGGQPWWLDGPPPEPVPYPPADD